MPARSIPLLRSYAWLTLLVAGSFVSVFAYRIAADSDRRRVETEFFRRADIRHTLTREVLNYYDAGLFGLRNIFLTDRPPTRAEFDRVAGEIISRYPGIASFEWAPIVADADRAAFEQQLAAELGHPAAITKTEGGTRLVPVPTKPEYAAVRFVSPAAGKDSVFGFDITTGLIADAVARARAERTMIVSPTVKLIETPDRNRIGLVWIWPIFAGPGSSAPLTGYVLGVFRLGEMLDESLRRHPLTVLDTLYIDPTESDPTRQVFYYQPGRADPTPAAWPTEEKFRASALIREQPIPLGGKTWRVLYRPRPEWIAELESNLPAWLLVVGLALTGTLSGWVFQQSRRAAVIERLVGERTTELSESRRKLDSFLHAMPGMAYRGTYDEHFDLLYVSEGVRALTGCEPAEFLARRVHLRDFIEPDDVARVRAVTRAGLESGREIEVEYRLRARDGREKWVLSRGRGVRDSDGQLLFEGLAIDITAQKDAERQRLTLERKLLEGQKLESIGLLAGGIAHDFNNLLTGILGNASVARLPLPEDSPIHQPLRAIETASLRAAELCHQMLAYAGKGSFIVEPVDLSVLVEGLVPLLKISVGRRAELHLALARGLPPVMADATQLRQIVMNLVINAADAIADRVGAITIVTGVTRVDTALLARCVSGSDCPPGDYLLLEVRDNGSGMTPEIRAKIFDPFFTTKFAGRGLGLAATLGIVRSHNGALAVESTPGQGSTFRLYLPPAKNSDARPAPPCAPGPTSWRHAGHALVIDDEEHVRTITAKILEHFGLTAHIAADGEAGLALFRENPAQFDVVLLDLLMPGLSGEETLAALRAAKPDVRVLLVSGFAEGDLLRRFASPHGKLSFLAKPFTREALANKLRALLD